jgi:hypothetical protein
VPEKNGDVASFQREDPSLVAAEPNAALTARNAEDIMNPGVKVHVVIDAVAPGVAPSISLEQVLDHGRRVMALARFDGAAIDDQRPSRMMGNETVVLEAGGKGFSRLDEFRSLSAYSFKSSRVGIVLLH